MLYDPVEEPARSPCAPPQERAGSFLDVLRRNAACDPAGVVYRLQPAHGEARDVSHLELARQVGRYAAALRALGDARAPQALRVVIALPQGLDFIAAFFACIAARAIAVPICLPENALQVLRLKLVLQDVGACAVLGRRQALDGSLAALRHDPEMAHVRWLPPYHDMGLIGGVLQPAGPSVARGYW